MSIEQALGIMAREVDAAIDPRCFAALQSVVEAGLPNAPVPQIGKALR